MKKLTLFLLTICTFILSACGFHFQTGELIPQELRQIVFSSDDQYDPMSMAMQKQLRINNIQVVSNQNDVPVLRINKTSNNDKVLSVFKQGREAEKILQLTVEASVTMPNKQRYPITANVNRTFFDNSRAALAKSSERETLWNDMREQAARQLIAKMIALQTQISK